MPASQIRFTWIFIKQINGSKTGSSKTWPTGTESKSFSTICKCFYSNGIFQPYKAKLYAYTLSPFDETIFIDADVIMFPKGRNLNDIFNELADVNFSIQNRSNYDVSTDIKPDMWADLQDIKKEYKVTTGTFYYISSEFFYFKKVKEVTEKNSDIELMAKRYELSKKEVISYLELIA